jgi:hypothetical protein
MLRVYHAAIWGNGAWTIKRRPVDLESLFVPTQTAQEEDE